MKIVFEFRFWSDDCWEFVSEDFDGYVHLNQHSEPRYRISQKLNLAPVGIMTFRKRLFGRFVR